MENFPKKKRGRPRKIPEPLVPEIPDISREYFAEVVQTDRSRANAHYAGSAREVVRAYAEQAKGLQMEHDPVLHAKTRLGMDWILTRRTVLAELGRMMDAEENPTEQEIKRFQDVVWHVAQRHDKMTAREAAAYVRRQRLGETKRKERIEKLHHAFNAAINLHRRRFPESSWADVQQAVEYTAKQVARKV